MRKTREREEHERAVAEQKKQQELEEQRKKQLQEENDRKKREEEARLKRQREEQEEKDRQAKLQQQKEAERLEKEKNQREQEKIQREKAQAEDKSGVDITEEVYIENKFEDSPPVEKAKKKGRPPRENTSFSPKPTPSESTDTPVYLAETAGNTHEDVKREEPEEKRATFDGEQRKNEAKSDKKVS
jgi:hypothetical protein